METLRHNNIGTMVNSNTRFNSVGGHQDRQQHLHSNVRAYFGYKLNLPSHSAYTDWQVIHTSKRVQSSRNMCKRGRMIMWQRASQIIVSALVAALDTPLRANTAISTYFHTIILINGQINHRHSKTDCGGGISPFYSYLLNLLQWRLRTVLVHQWCNYQYSIGNQHILRCATFLVMATVPQSSLSWH
jgi:hypothetical protein